MNLRIEEPLSSILAIDSSNESTQAASRKLSLASTERTYILQANRPWYGRAILVAAFSLTNSSPLCGYKLACDASQKCAFPDVLGKGITSLIFSIPVT